ncbi:hypothetical protein [Deinococcus fonticola]|uniref:hypothetical protein n=1 Tax=Deinococcus fonticola TaxID=2528713 RepID=UPI0010752F78|nr:hypothetical protein [Deinococcus fonticola]
MKKALVIPFAALLLAGCTPTQVIPPAESVTGNWRGSLSRYGLSVNISIRITRTDAPAQGDFTGTGQLRGALSIDDAVIKGNVNSGVLTAQKGSDVVTCTGRFKNNNEYNGDCSYGGFNAPLYMSRQGD